MKKASRKSSDDLRPEYKRSDFTSLVRGKWQMTRYKNLAGDSGVVAYDIGNDSIDVEFVDKRVYKYTYESAGRSNVEHMKKLAAAGRGLSTFISAVVKDGYASRSK